MAPPAAPLAGQCADGAPHDLVENGAETVCQKCGVVVDQSHLVAHVEYIGDGGAMQGANVTATSNVCAEMTFQLAALNIVNDLVLIKDQAKRLLNLAFASSVINNRSVKRCCAVALYATLRQLQRGVLLIEFTEVTNVSVFTLGALWYKFRLEFPSIVGLNQSEESGTNDPSLLVARFAGLLKLGDATHAIVNDAMALVKRMRRDWISDGRRPAGICAACLLLAARMHGIERSLHEVAHVMKLSKLTVLERLEEFQNTPAAHMSAPDLRTWAGNPPEAEDEAALPPSFVRNRIRDDPSIVASVRVVPQPIHDTPADTPDLPNETHDDTLVLPEGTPDNLPLESAAVGANRSNGDEASASPTPTAASSTSAGTTSKPPRKKRTPEENLAIVARLNEGLERERTHPASVGRYDSPSLTMQVDLPARTLPDSEILSLTQLLEEKEAELPDVLMEEEEEEKADDDDAEDEAPPPPRATRRKRKRKPVDGDPDRGRVILTEADMRLSDLDDGVEIKGVFATPEEVEVRRTIWNVANREYLEQQLKKEKERLEKGRESRPKRARTEKSQGTTGKSKKSKKSKSKEKENDKGKAKSKKTKSKTKTKSTLEAAHEVATTTLSKKINRAALENAFPNEIPVYDVGRGSTSAAARAAEPQDVEGTDGANHKYGLPGMYSNKDE
ncbi:transcription factor TFIIIB subunit brf1 [Allomyces javanicus]|nr:transcription factor TFIIIB subunit brf1 [Allomyces javanicus]